MTKADVAPRRGAARVRQPGRLDEQLCFALYAASARLTRLYRPLLEPLGLTYPQYLVMLALWERAPRTVGDLAQSLESDFGTLSPLLKRMETLGFVERSRDPDDERRVRVDLTPRGDELRNAAAAIPEALFCRVALPRGDLVTLRSALKAFSRAMNDGADPERA